MHVADTLANTYEISRLHVQEAGQIDANAKDVVCDLRGCIFQVFLRMCEHVDDILRLQISLSRLPVTVLYNVADVLVVRFQLLESSRHTRRHLFFTLLSSVRA